LLLLLLLSWIACTAAFAVQAEIATAMVVAYAMDLPILYSVAALQLP
jgi:hypothetical protein